jgi:hypothetical protein
MKLEDKIDRARYRAAAWFAGWLRAFGFGSTALALLLANERFVCPLCVLLRAMRRQQISVPRRISKFCTECLEYPRRFRRQMLRCFDCIFGNLEWLTPPMYWYAKQVWSPQKIPLFLLNRNLRN